MQSSLEKIDKYILEENNQKYILDFWQKIVNMESWTQEKDQVKNLGKFLKYEFEKEGLDCDLLDLGNNTSSLICHMNKDLKKKPIIFSGHFDTVFPSNSFGENPFKIIEGRAYGPGVLDMKGGIAIILLIIKALNSISYREYPIKILLSGDEEDGHANSSGDKFFLREAKDGLLAFNMETGLINNKICIGRKGRLGFKVTVKGIGSHAGNDFTSGRNAIEEMAHKILAFQNLTNLKKGTTISVTTVQGGSAANAIPEECSIDIDCRFESLKEMERIKNEIEKICDDSIVEGTQTSFNLVNSMPAFETTNKVLEFYSFVEKIAKDYGFPELGKTKLGGGSDASYIGLANTPVLCSFGVQGQWNHTKNEYALVDSVFERSKLIATIILNLHKYKDPNKKI